MTFKNKLLMSIIVSVTLLSTHQSIFSDSLLWLQQDFNTICKTIPDAKKKNEKLQNLLVDTDNAIFRFNDDHLERSVIKGTLFAFTVPLSAMSGAITSECFRPFWNKPSCASFLPLSLAALCAYSAITLPRIALSMRSLQEYHDFKNQIQQELTKP